MKKPSKIASNIYKNISTLSGKQIVFKFSDGDSIQSHTLFVVVVKKPSLTIGPGAQMQIFLGGGGSLQEPSFRHDRTNFAR